MNKCGCNNCFECPYPDCIVDAPKKDRSEYQHKYYLNRKRNTIIIHRCAICDKRLSGEVYHMGKKNFCGLDCLLCYLWDKNENKISLVKI